MKHEDNIYASEFKTSVFIKNVVKAPNVTIGKYTYYDDQNNNPVDFEKNCILFNFYEFSKDKLIIGNFVQIAEGVKILMNQCNHRLNSATTYPFSIMDSSFKELIPEHLEELPFKGDTVIGNDVWIGREAMILPGVKIGDGAIIGARSVVSKDIPPYAIAAGNPIRIIKYRFSDEIIELLLKYKWWDKEDKDLKKILPILVDKNIDKLREFLQKEVN